MNELDYLVNIIEFCGPRHNLYHIKYKLQFHYLETSLSRIHQSRQGLELRLMSPSDNAPTGSSFLAI